MASRILKPSISFINLALPKNSPQRIIKFRGLAVENFSDTPSIPLFNGYDIPGRSSPVQSYQGGEARTVSFTLSLHRDILSDYSHILNNQSKFPSNKKKQSSIIKRSNGKVQDGNISVIFTASKGVKKSNKEEQLSIEFRDLINQFKAMNYPRYSKSGVIPPNVFCEIGTSIRIKGIPNITIDYKKPIDRFGRYMSVDINVSITEVVERSFDATEVIGNMNRYYKIYHPVVRGQR